MTLLAVLLFLGCWCLACWLQARQKRRPVAQGALDVTGKPFPDIRQHHRDDETDALRDIAAEGGFAPWPGIEAIDAVKRANPQLSDMQAKAVAVARTRLKATR